MDEIKPDDEKRPGLQRPPLKNQLLGYFKKPDVKHIPLFLGFVVIVFLVGLLVYNLTDKSSETSASNQAKSIFSGDEMQDYSSPENEFTIKMPGFPTIDDNAYKDEENEIRLVSYERAIENETIFYSVEVHDYSGKKFNTKELLEKKLAEKVKGTPGAQLSASTLDTFNGLDTIEAAYTFPSKNKTGISFVRVLEYKSKVYVLHLEGSSTEKFAEFADSLRFNQ